MLLTILVGGLIFTVVAFKPTSRVNSALTCTTRPSPQLTRQPLSIMTPLHESASLLLSEQKIQIEAYESGGVPPVVLFASLGLVLAFGLVPVISRKRQVAKNSRSIDDSAFMDEVLEEKITNVETLNSMYDDKGAVGRYTKD